MPSPAPHFSWLDALRGRFAAHWPLKSLLIPLVTTGFFATYFLLLQHPQFPITLMPLTAPDRWIGFSPAALVPYLSLWAYVVLAAGSLHGRREIGVYLVAATTIMVTGLGIFWLWPTATPIADVDWADYPSFQFLKQHDASGNACPSLHVAFAVFTAVWFLRLLRQLDAPVFARAACGGWGLAIVYSTIATRQHVTVDVLAGAALGGAAGLFDPRVAGYALAAPCFRLNRKNLALGVCVLAKITVLALGLGQTHPTMAAVLFLGPDLWIVGGLILPNVATLIPTATRFETVRREIWLTIDDGPEPATCPAMLDLLERHGAKATFFVIGEKVVAHPGMVREILRRGHSVGNHTQTHPLASFWLAGPWRTAREIDGGAAALRAEGAPATPWFRAPAGIKTWFLRGALARRGAVLIGWSARGREIMSTSIDVPLRRLRRSLRPGAILLVHESAAHAERRVALLAALLDQLAREGYRCVLPERERLR